MPEGARPLERFVAAANSLGQLLDGDQQEALMQVGAVQGCRLPAGVQGCTFGRRHAAEQAGPAGCCWLLQAATLAAALADQLRTVHSRPCLSSQACLGSLPLSVGAAQSHDQGIDAAGAACS